jgi:hypothetical protein
MLHAPRHMMHNSRQLIADNRHFPDKTIQEQERSVLKLKVKKKAKVKGEGEGG